MYPDQGSNLRSSQGWKNSFEFLLHAIAMPALAVMNKLSSLLIILLEIVHLYGSALHDYVLLVESVVSF